MWTADVMGLLAPVTRLLRSLMPAEAKLALQALMSSKPTACYEVLNHHLVPAAAELLTRHFEAADATCPHPGRL